MHHLLVIAFVAAMMMTIATNAIATAISLLPAECSIDVKHRDGHPEIALGMHYWTH